MAMKSVLDGSPFGPRRLPSWLSRSSKKAGSTRTVRRSVTGWRCCAFAGGDVRLDLAASPFKKRRRDLAQVRLETGANDRLALIWSQLLQFLSGPDLRCCHVVTVSSPSLAVATRTVMTPWPNASGRVSDSRACPRANAVPGLANVQSWPSGQGSESCDRRATSNGQHALRLPKPELGVGPSVGRMPPSIVEPSNNFSFSSVWKLRTTTASVGHLPGEMERMTGIEPAYSAWEASVRFTVTTL
jgi:hypothetical protein